jgi:hypothetical protein
VLGPLFPPITTLVECLYITSSAFNPFIWVIFKVFMVPSPCWVKVKVVVLFWFFNCKFPVSWLKLNQYPLNKEISLLNIVDDEFDVIYCVLSSNLSILSISPWSFWRIRISLLNLLISVWTSDKFSVLAYSITLSK